MGYRGQTMHMPMNAVGFQFNRNTDLLIPTALVEGTRNVDFHEGGVSKRGGSALYLGAAIAGAPIMRGDYDFRMRNGNHFIMFATSAGKIYQTNEAGLLKTGKSTNNFFHFSTFNDKVYICDGASAPEYWDGAAALTTAVLAPTSWTTNNSWPFQIVQHARGANARNWAITREGVWASKNNDGTDFSDAQVKFIPVYAEGGLVGGFDFNGTLFVWNKTKTFIIEDTDTNSTLWGYSEAIWEGGAASWRLICKAGNELYIMTEEGLIYTLAGVTATGDYTAASITRPAYIDRYIRENVTLGNIDNYFMQYDRTRRAIIVGLQVTGSANNTGLTFFIDRPADVGWIIHDNLDFPSGYQCMCACEYRVSAGVYQIWTGDSVGQIWKLGQTARSDNSNGFTSAIKTRALDMGNPRMWKHFAKGRLRTRAQGNYNLTVRTWIDGVRKPDVALSLSGSGAAFDSAIFDTSVFAEDSIIPVPFDIKAYGFDVQLQIVNSNAGEDFFLSELLVDFENCGVR